MSQIQAGCVLELQLLYDCLVHLMQAEMNKIKVTRGVKGKGFLLLLNKEADRTLSHSIPAISDFESKGTEQQESEFVKGKNQEI